MPRESAGIYVDQGYKTALGTAFYDRVPELGRLEALIGGVRTVVVYGPRGVGKSELARYLAVRRLRVRSLLVDSRRRRLEDLLGFSSGERRLLESIEGLLSSALGLPRGLVGLVEEVYSRLSPRFSLSLTSCMCSSRGTW
ncbi:MAG: ATP-binding protein [Desulfurococcales archaeon]|nr:ATP-binding protein [Desulfurococcales archaeon]